MEENVNGKHLDFAQKTNILTDISLVHIPSGSLNENPQFLRAHQGFWKGDKKMGSRI